MRYFVPFLNSDDEYMISFDSNNFNKDEYYDFRSSYHVLAARLMGLSYPDYLMYMVKNYKANLRGSKGYCYVTFNDVGDCKRACDHLEFLWKSVIEQVPIITDV